MNAEIICITAEHLPEEHSGFLTAYISKKLFELGHRTTFETLCPPDKAEVENRLSAALQRSDLVIVLGGIEPETNSVAKTALSALSGIPLVASEEALASVKAYCSSINIEPSPEQLTAGIILKDATVLKNELGLSVGLYVSTQSAKILLLPYAEGELTHMFEAHVAPMLSPYGISATHTVNVIGLNEQEIENMLSRLSKRNEYAINIEKYGAEFAVRVSAVAETRDIAEAICGKAVASVKFALGKSAYAVDSKGIQYETVALLREKGLSVSTAESCTAGMVSEMLTDVGGSSEVFEYGISAYSNRIKTEVLKIPQKIIDEYSAISFETAKAMAVNVKALSGATLGIGITGNAGPSASENKPVGLVYVALADQNSYIVKELHFSAELGREEIRAAAAITALDLIRCYALSYPESMAGMMKYTPNPDIFHVLEPKPTERVEESAPVINSEPENKPSQEKDSLSGFTMVFDRETDEDFFDESIAKEYKFIKRFNISEPLTEIWIKTLAFFKSLIPMKSDSPKKLAIKIGFILSLAIFITSAAVLWTQLTGDDNQREILMQAQAEFHSNLTPELNNNTAAFKPFYEKNEDIKGWITIAGTKVDNPIYQSSDNDYYLTHNMYKEKSRYGALFFDYRCELSSIMPSQNLTVYGHEMKDGSMFGTLKKYKSLSQYKQNPTFTVKTLDKTEVYKIFSVMVINAKPEDDNGYLFNYTIPDFNSQKDFLKWADEARERSIISTDIDVIANDRVVTLVTCINDFDDARFVIMARLTRDNEDAKVNTENAALNPNPRYPQAWYDKRGLEGYVDPNSSDNETSSVINSSSDLVSDGSLSDTNSESISPEENLSDAVSSDTAQGNNPVSSDSVPSETPTESGNEPQASSQAVPPLSSTDASDSVTSSSAPESSSAVSDSETTSESKSSVTNESEISSATQN